MLGNLIQNIELTTANPVVHCESSVAEKKQFTLRSKAIDVKNGRDCTRKFSPALANIVSW